MLNVPQFPGVSSDPGTACSEMQRAPVRAFVVPQKGAVAENSLSHNRLPKDLIEVEEVAPKTAGAGRARVCMCPCNSCVAIMEKIIPFPLCSFWTLTSKARQED